MNKQSESIHIVKAGKRLQIKLSRAVSESNPKTRVLLIVPRFISNYGENYVFPIGLAYISSALKHAGYQVSCLNLNSCKNDYHNVIAETINTVNPHVVGCGGLSVHYSKIRDVFLTCRAINSKIFLIAGGGAISSAPELMLEALDIDAGVIGEGEEIIVELLAALEQGKPLEDVHGIVFRDTSNGIIRTKTATRIRSLDTLAWPDYDGFNFENFQSVQRTVDDYFYHTTDDPRSLEMISSRSCPFECSFCFHPTGRVYRERSLDNFFAELDFMVAKFKINRLAVLDELFAVKKERLIEFCNRIKPYRLQWMAQLRVDILDEESLRLMHNSNCQVISYGIESVVDSVLTGMKKKTTRAEIEQALSLSYANKIGIQGNLIFGDTSETLDTMMQSLQWWGKNRQYMLWLSPIQHYPGTQIYDDAIKVGAISNKIKFLEAGCPIINTTVIPATTYNELIQEILLINSTVCFPGRLITCTLLKDRDLLRGDAYSITCICPHCGCVDRHKHITHSGWTTKLFRITCCNCFQRYDIPYIFSKYEINPIAHNMYLSARDLFERNMPEEALAKANFGHQLESHHAHLNFLIGMIYFAQGNLAYSRVYVKNALILNCLEPVFHKTYAEIHRQFGNSVIAEIFESQVKILEASRALAVP